jgi:hypothetical protein
MGITEVLVHAYDICAGLNLPWAPDEALCDRVLRRLFPEAPADTPRWEMFLWCTGRGELPGRPRLDQWSWSSEPLRKTPSVS